MSTDQRPRDDDPSEMTDFEKNATNEAIVSGELEAEDDAPAEPRERQERGNTGPGEEPGFGQGA